MTSAEICRVCLGEVEEYAIFEKINLANPMLYTMRKLQPFSFLLLLVCLTLPVYAVAQTENTNVISYVDHSLDGSQKYVLRVDGKPFYMTNIQIRMEKLRYTWGWDAAAREAIVARAAADGFNTLSIPIHWREVEPEKDRFDWTTLDEYLNLVAKYGLKMELLWFGQNNVGGVAWLRTGGDNPQLRVPDYVLHSPAPGSTATTSEFNVRRDISDYVMDLADDRLKERETYVLGRVMEHIAEWDAAGGGKHTVIGVQINNEVFGTRVSFPNALVIDYLSHLAGAVKQSKYVVWTRINCVYWEADGRIIENEQKRFSPEGTNLDFAGLDTYKHHPAFTSTELFTQSMRSDIPYVGKNYRMFMEIGAEAANIAQLQMAALSGNCAFDYYDMIGPDNHGLYDRNGEMGFVPHGSYIEDVRLVNKILNSAMSDIALNANGYGLFVHNWKGYSPYTETSTEGIGFTPGYSSSQGISILRSNTETVLMSTLGGTFTLPDSLGINGATKGYFDADDRWVNQGNVSFSSARNLTSVFVEAGATVRLTHADKRQEAPKKILQAEFARIGGAAILKSKYVETGFAGNGYVTIPKSGAASITWTNVDGYTGGERKIRIRYSYTEPTAARISLFVNGKGQSIFLEPTGSTETFRYFTVTVPMESGPVNTIGLEASTGDTIGVAGAEHDSGGNIDEIQIF